MTDYQVVLFLDDAPKTAAQRAGFERYMRADGAKGACVDARAAATANGTAIQQYTCNGTTAQQFQFRSTDAGYTRIAIRGNPQQVVDVTGVSTADNAPLRLWSYGGGGNQQWLPVREAPGRYHFTTRHSGKCLSATSSAVNGVQLVQRACDDSAAQSFHLAAHP